MNGVTLHGSFTSSQLHRTDGSASEPEGKVSASDLTIVQISEEWAAACSLSLLHVLRATLDSWVQRSPNS